jgi:wobble nucleotide-excising tRNase
MRVKKILKINNLGTLNNFQWPDNCDGFKQYNFFYGWNYSGKTTLSRIFRCLEIKSIHSDFPNAEFSLETDNGNVTEQDISDNYQIRVFNEDFVDGNFLWNNEDAQIEPVLILGKEAKDLESKLRELEEQKEKDGEQLKAKRGEKERIERALENSLTDKASEIRNILGITNPKEFDKNSLQENINGIKDSYECCILSADEKEKILSIYRSKKAEEVAFKTVQLKLSTFTFEVRNILSQKVTAQQIIEKLKENPKLSSWVKEGIDLHQNEEICQFCGNPLPSDLFERLNKHFSDEFDDLMEQISTKEEKISAHIEEIKNLILPDKARLFENLQSEFERSLKSLNAKKVGYIQTLDLLKIELKKKEKSLLIL